MSSWTLAADNASTLIEQGETTTHAGGTGIVTNLVGNTITTSFAQSEITAKTSLGTDNFFLVYDVSDGTQWNIHRDTVRNALLGADSDTLVIPIYAQDYDAALVTGSGYRGWRVPQHLNNAKIIQVEYSVQGGGTGTFSCQLISGGFGYLAATSISAYKRTIGTRTLSTGELYVPDVGTTGSGKTGLLINLIITR
jgi:hypothetical protein